MSENQIIEIFMKKFKNDIKLIYEETIKDFITLTFLYLPSDVKIIFLSNKDEFHINIWINEIKEIKKEKKKLTKENLKEKIIEIKKYLKNE